MRYSWHLMVVALGLLAGCSGQLPPLPDTLDPDGERYRSEPPPKDPDEELY